MIIISQERDTIINFDMIYCIWLEEPCITQPEEKDKYFRIFIQSDGCSNLIGYYKTKERAKEVLDEIIDYMVNKSNIVMTQNEINLSLKGEAFYMPLE